MDKDTDRFQKTLGSMAGLRLVKDYERLPETVARLHFVAFACVLLQQATGILLTGS